MGGVYKHSNFQPDSFGHGGNKRTAQIDQLLNEAGIAFNNANFSNELSVVNKLKLYAKGAKHHKMLFTRHKSKYAAGRYITIFEDFIEDHSPDLFILESTTGYNLLLPQILKKHAVPVIALPHNIESLVPGSSSVFTGKRGHEWLNEELDYLSFCNKVITISKDEEGLLTHNNIVAASLPYYPPQQAEGFLLNIRQKRLDFKKGINRQKKVLLLGTFYNQPTKEGYMGILGTIRHNNDLEINIAGYGSEQLRGVIAQDNNIRIWGSVSNDTLAQLITEADCAVVHQPFSGGALTRITELLVAGLPVMANEHAARGNRHLAGLHVYNSAAQLLEMIADPKQEVPPVIQPPPEQETFKNFMKGFSHC